MAKQAKAADVADQCPWLWELLTRLAYEDGSERKGATLTIWYDRGGTFKVILTDRDLGLKWFTDAQALESLWTDLEAHLVDPETIPTETKEGRAKRLQEAKKKPLDKG